MCWGQRDFGRSCSFLADERGDEGRRWGEEAWVVGASFASATSTLPCGTGRPVSDPIGDAWPWRLTWWVLTRALPHTHFPPSPRLPSGRGELHWGLPSFAKSAKIDKVGGANMCFQNASYSLETRLKINFHKMRFSLKLMLVSRYSAMSEWIWKCWLPPWGACGGKGHAWIG